MRVIIGKSGQRVRPRNIFDKATGICYPLLEHPPVAKLTISIRGFGSDRLVPYQLRILARFTP